MKLKLLMHKQLLVRFIFLFVLLGFIVRGFDVSVINGAKYYQESILSLTKTKSESPSRGSIVSADGQRLAYSEKVFDLVVNKNAGLKDYFDSLLVRINEELPELVYKLANFSPDGERAILLEGMTEAEADMASKIFINDKSLQLESYFKRVYSLPEVFAHTIGYVGKTEESDLNDYYSPQDYLGKYGIEKVYENELRGVKGLTEKFGEKQVILDSTPGSTVYLTLDAYWQHRLYDLMAKYNWLMGAAGGAGVIMNVSSGQIKAMVSYPGFDTNLLLTGISTEEYQSLINDRNLPMIDKVASTSFTPGSIFKLITSYILLEGGTVDPSSTFYSNSCIDLGGYNFCEYNRNFYGTLNLVNALTVSSNLYFCNYILEYSKQPGVRPAGEVANIFKLDNVSINPVGQNTPSFVDLPGFPGKSGQMFDGDYCNSAIGQGATTITPMHMMLAIAAIHNSGSYIKPQIVEKIRNYYGELDYQYSPEVISKIPMSQTTRDLIIEGMYEAAHSYRSPLSYFFRYLPYNLRVKTGSAETVEVPIYPEGGPAVERVHSWLVGLFDKDGQTYAFTFFQRFGGGGYYLSPLLVEFLTSI